MQIWESETFTIVSVNEAVWCVRLGPVFPDRVPTPQTLFRDSAVRLIRYTYEKHLLGVVFEVLNPEYLKQVRSTRASLLLLAPNGNFEENLNLFTPLYSERHFTLHSINNCYHFAIAGNFFDSKSESLVVVDE